MIEIVAPAHDAGADTALLNEVRAYLARHEAVNSIQLSALMAADAFDPATAVLVARHESGIAGLAMLSGAFNILLSHIEHDAAIPALVDAVIERGIAIPGVMGPVAASSAFADAWVARTGVARSPGMAQRILATSTVRLPPGVAGSWRHMTEEDQPLLLEWFTSFAGEAEQVGLAEAREAGAAMATRAVGQDSGGIIWQDESGAPVSIACYKAPTLSGIRIGPVYTPPEHRRRGFAGAVTAAATQLLLDRGHAFVCLYTDAANATANHVYESIGYEFVADSMIYRLTPG